MVGTSQMVMLRRAFLIVGWIGWCMMLVIMVFALA